MRTAATMASLLIALAACGNDGATGDGDGDGDGDGGGDGRFPAQTISDACAPNDAAALRITLAAESDAATCAAAGFGESLVITVYSREITPPRIFQLAGIVAEADASYCPAGDGPPCRLPVGGMITFESYQLDGPASGTFSIDLGDEVIEGDFDAERCEPETPIRCG